MYCFLRKAFVARWNCLKEHSRGAVLGDINALAIADGTNWEETKVLNVRDIGGMGKIFLKKVFRGCPINY